MIPPDSTVLAYTMKLLNERYDYGVELILLSIDEGITGYRDDSLEVGRLNLPAETRYIIIVGGSILTTLL